MRSTGLSYAALFLLAPSAFAGGSPENALLLVDPTNPESLYVANYYRSRRDLPDVNLVYMPPVAAGYAQFSVVQSDVFLGTLDNLALADHIDYVILPPGGNFFVPAAGLVSDGCAPVNRFAAPSPYTLVFQESTILAGTGSSLANGFFRNGNDARAFDSNTTWSAGVPNVNGKRYYIGAMLGYTGPLGNTLAEVLAMIDRSVAADGTHPTGTIYFMQTNDPARSGPRQGLFPTAVSAIVGLGGQAQHLLADLPFGNLDGLGVMTGLSDPDIANPAFAVLPGSFCDHLTSFAATFDVGAQVKMSRWITKGASGTSGAVEEPCNYSGKFPTARLHVFYEQGSSLGEAWFRSLGFAPFQQLFTGDPLTRPFTYIPNVSISVPSGPVSGTIALTPSATTPHPTAQIGEFELFVDGRSIAVIPAGNTFALDTTAFADGVHELRVLAYDDTPVRSAGRAFASLTTDNFGRGASLVPALTSGDLSTRFDFTLAGLGAPIDELLLMQGSRVIAAATGASGIASVHGRILGAGDSRVWCEARFADGTRARTGTTTISVANAEGVPDTAVPLVSSFTKHVRADRAALIELPATFSQAFTSATCIVTTTPAQATVLASGPLYLMMRPNPGASGTDTLVFHAVNAHGPSTDATVTIVYDTPAVCPPPTNYCVAAPNSFGSGAHMSSSGSTSIGANDFLVSAFGLPPNTTCIVMYGANATQSPLGNGFLCIDSPFRRIGVLQASFLGDVQRPIDFTRFPFNSGPMAITAGTEWNFQMWYRNVAGGGALFNLTDGLHACFGL